MTIWAILPAAGIGRRMGSETPKQYLPLSDEPVISIALRRLLAVSVIAKVVVVLHPEDSYWHALSVAVDDERVNVVTGGDERSQSVLNGLKCLAAGAQDDDWVLVHDAVRPCVRTTDIENLISHLEGHAVGGLLGAPADNTLKRVTPTNSVKTTIDREGIWNAFTPQMFRYGLLKSAFEKVAAENIAITDEASAVELLGQQPQMILGSKDNIKITHQGDLRLAEMILAEQARE